jgi:hypothetical protein
MGNNCCSYLGDLKSAPLKKNTIETIFIED